MEGISARKVGLSACGALLRCHDRERFLSCLFAPAERRDALFALYAFNHEVAKTAEVVSEPMLGQIRLQWWRDSLDGITVGEPREHEVVTPLAAAIKRYALPMSPFERLIDAREADLEPQPMADQSALETYAEATSSSLIELALRVLHAPDPPTPRELEAGRCIGIAWALVGLLRAVPFHAQHKRLYLPQDLVDAEGLDVAALFELKSSRSLAAVVRHVAQRAKAQLDDGQVRPNRRSLPALLPATLAKGHLRRLRRADYDPFDPGVSQSEASAWPLALAWLIGRL